MAELAVSYLNEIGSCSLKLGRFFVVTVRASQFARRARILALRGSFACFFKVIFRSGLLFLIGGRLGVAYFR